MINTKTLFNNIRYQTIIRCCYVRQRDLDNIEKNYGETKWEKAKMYGVMFAKIGKEGFSGVKKDYYLYKQLRKKKQLSDQDIFEKIRLRHDFYRLGPILVIQALPMTGPLFFLYMYTYPGSIPSWFLIDKYHEKHELEIRQKQKQALKYFKQKKIQSKNLDFDNLSLNQARKLCQLLFGSYRDGTIGYNRLFGKKIQYFLSIGFSKFLMKRKLKYKFNSDLFNIQMLKKMTLNEKIKWKYDKIMDEGELMPKYEETLTPEELEARQKSDKQ